MTARRPLRPPPEPPRTTIPTDQLVELERRPLRYDLAAVFYGWPGPRRTRT